MTAAAYLELADAYRLESEQAIWQNVLSGLGSIKRHIVTDRDLDAYRQVVADLIGPIHARLGWDPDESDSDLTRRLRGMILRAMGILVEDAGVIERSRGIADQWIDGEGKPDPDVAQASLTIYAANGDESAYDRVFAAYEEAGSPQMKLKLLQALTSFDGDDFVDKTFDAVRGRRIKTQDASWVIGLLFGGRRSGAYAWSQMRRDWEALIALMPPMTIRRMIDGIPALSEPDAAADVEAFFAETPVPPAQKTVHQNVERMRSNALLRSRETERFADHLRNRPS
jgi:hypothetical protein